MKIYPLATKEVILKKYSDAIFRRYFQPYEIGKMYKSPLRKEDNASFNIFEGKQGYLVYKDFGDSSGNAIDFVMRAKSLSFYDAIRTIVVDLGLKYRVNGVVVDNYRDEDEYVFKKKEKKELILKPIYFDTWTETDHNYWQADHKLSDMNVLLRHRVRSASELSINETPVWGATRGNPIYVYHEKYDEKWWRKAYRPTGMPEEKWRSDYPDAANMVHGVDLLRVKQDDLIITKSVKDVVLLEDLGYEAISPQGEDMPFPEGVMSMLKNWYKRIFVMFDNDWDKKENVGRRLSDKFAKQHNVLQLLITEETRATDVADLMRKQSPSIVKELIESWKN